MNKYGDDIENQIVLIQNLVNKSIEITDPIKDMKNTSHIDPYSFILDYMGRGNDKRNKLSQTMGFNEEIVFRGIQNLTRNKFNHLPEDKEDRTAIQNSLKAIFVNEQTLSEMPDFANFKGIFTEPKSAPTSVLFWLYPNQYIPFDMNSKKLYKKMGLMDGVNCNQETTWECYESVLEKIKNDDNFGASNGLEPKKIVALSYYAWLMDNKIDDLLDIFLENKSNIPKNIILTGMPGTGKTYSITKYLEDNQFDESRYKFVQFHPSYDYEDFIEGLKPVAGKDGIEFQLVDGVFKELCKTAYENKKNPYVMVIDEINRADISRVFGELLFCLEYRDKFVETKMTNYIKSLKDDERKKHSISNDHIGQFCIPENIIILGTMNEVDRSIDAFDLALRRRFIWEEIGFDESAIRLYHKFLEDKKFIKHIDNLISSANELNKKLADDIGQNYQLGHTYFFKTIDYYQNSLRQAKNDLWDFHLKSIIREYCKIKYGDNDLKSEIKKYHEVFLKRNS
jgi:hypothetical protein